MQRAKQSRVVIKGRRDGLVFRLDDRGDFSEVLDDLERTLSDKTATLLEGPDIAVTVFLGRRQISHHEEMRLRELLALRPNLMVTDIQSTRGHYRRDYNAFSSVKYVTGMVRAGQVIETAGSLLLLGDVNPGGTVRAEGHVFVFGALRGVAHAGCNGEDEAVIVAAQMAPTQLRIGTVISRSPDGEGLSEGMMEFAYVYGDAIAIEKIQQIHQIRPRMG